jgi:hypothetical protein
MNHTNTVMVAIVVASQKTIEKLKSSNDSNEGNNEESNEPDYDEDKDQLEEEQEEETGEVTKNQDRTIGEEADYDKVIARYKAEGFGAENATKDMKIVPVNFNKEHKAMLGHCKMILEHEPRKIAINRVFDKLITALRTAVDNDGTLDKESTSYNDIFDAFRLALKFYHFQERTD